MRVRCAQVNRSLCVHACVWMLAQTLVDVYTTVHGVVISDLTSGSGEGNKDGGVTLPKHLFNMGAVAKGTCSLVSIPGSPCELWQSVSCQELSTRNTRC